jgi:hypothetical protein
MFGKSPKHWGMIIWMGVLPKNWEQDGRFICLRQDFLPQAGPMVPMKIKL